MKREWLAQTVEVAIEPELEIVDPHHHLWPEPPGRRWYTYDVADLRIDTDAGHRVVDTVFVECMAAYRTDGPEHLRCVGETEWVAPRAAETARTPGARIAGIVSHASLRLGAAVEEVLDAHIAAADGLFRGIRDAGAWDADERIPRTHTNPVPGLYGLDSFRAGMRVLAAKGLTFEAWQYHTQLGDVAALARGCPDVTIVLNHIGAPIGIGPYEGRRDEVLAVWRSAMTDVASCPNVVLKVGGIGMSRYGVGFETWQHPPTSDQLLAVWGDELRFCVDTFGPDRCMFESNFPVDAESCSYTVLWNAFKKVSVGYSPSERAALFSETARRVYRL
jgi:L-fuconolactonase